MTIEGETTTSYPLSPRNRVKRLHERGSYDRAKIHGLLDASMLCHVSYVVDGQPYCTPTFFWREGNTLYWHGSSASRMLRNQSDGQRACLTVAHLDSLVLARCGFNHSADYRAVMAFGTAHLVDDPAEKERALVAMVDRFFPDRTASLRQSTAQEIKATSVRTVLGAPEPCPRLLDGVKRPATLSGYSEGRLLEDALRDAHFAHYAGG